MALHRALKETIRVQGGRVPLVGRHLARLEAGGCEPAVLARVRDEIERVASRWDEDYGRMTAVLGVDESVEVQITSRPSSIDVPGGPRVALVETAVPPLPPGAAKPADRTFWDEALATARREHADPVDAAVLVSPQGTLIDASQASVWLCFGTRLLTPPSPPALAGVSRRVVFDLAPTLALSAEETVLTPEDYETADEVFLTTAVAGAVAIRGRGGPVSDRVAEAFGRLWRADLEDA